MEHVSDVMYSALRITWEVNVLHKSCWCHICWGDDYYYILYSLFAK